MNDKTSPSSQTPPPPSMTVDELVLVLQNIQAKGLGSRQVGIPYAPLQTTVGSSPKANIVSVTEGFDWDANVVFLKPSVSFGVLDMEQRRYAQSLESKLSKLRFGVKKISESLLFSPEERMSQIKDLIDQTQPPVRSSVLSSSTPPPKSNKP